MGTLQISRRGGRLDDQMERADQTRAALLATARRMFARHGFQDTRTEALAAEAQVTQGSLYHHFRGKKDLFEAAFRQVLDETQQGANARAVDAASDLWSQTLVAFRSYLGLIGASPEFQKIVLIDGPAVFGWPAWRQMLSEYSAAPIEETLSRLMEGGVIARQPAAPLASLLLSALNEAALVIAHAEDHEAARAQMTEAFMSLCDGLRARNA